MGVYMDPDADMVARPMFGTLPLPPLERGARQARTVLVVMAVFNYDVKLCPREAKAIARALHGYPFKAAIYASRMIGYIVQTDLPADELMERLSLPLAAGCIDRGWVYTPGADVASNLPLDPFSEKVAEAWKSVRGYNRKISTDRNLPRRIFVRTVEAEDGRSSVETTILDQHPLSTPRANIA